MRKRIQHHRKQKPSRVQLVRVRAPDQGVNETGKLVGANVDARPLVWAVGADKGKRALFSSPKQAEREALFALACKLGDAGTWQALDQLDRGEPADDLALIDLLELGMVDDDCTLNRAGRMVLERLKTVEGPEVKPAAAVPISTGAMINQARAAAEHGFIDLDAPLLLHLKIDGDSHLVNVFGTKVNGDSLQLEVEGVTL